MEVISTLNLSCHVRAGASADVTVSVNETDYNFNLPPTINWVPSSTFFDAHILSFNIVPSAPWFLAMQAYNLEMKIKTEGNDILIGAYTTSKGQFLISTQPVWNEAGWQPYDISGHQGENAQYQGNGSLQILNGQTVEFSGTVIVPTAR